MQKKKRNLRHLLSPWKQSSSHCRKKPGRSRSAPTKDATGKISHGEMARSIVRRGFERSHVIHAGASPHFLLSPPYVFFAKSRTLLLPSLFSFPPFLVLTSSRHAPAVPYLVFFLPTADLPSEFVRQFPPPRASPLLTFGVVFVGLFLGCPRCWVALLLLSLSWVLCVVSENNSTF